jgi:hypothetical protein
MMLDSLLMLADAQESTVSVASTSYVDTVKSGDAYEGAWLYVRIDTAYTVGAGTPNARFSIQTSGQAAFTTVTELASSSTYVAASLTAGKELKIRIPPGACRFIRGYQTCQGLITATSTAAISDSHYFGAGKFDMFIVKDVDVDRSLAGL